MPIDPITRAAYSLRTMRAKARIANARMPRPSTAGQTSEEASWAESWIAATPRIGMPSVTKMLQTPTAVIAAVLMVD